MLHYGRLAPTCPTEGYTGGTEPPPRSLDHCPWVLMLWPASTMPHLGREGWGGTTGFLAEPQGSGGYRGPRDAGLSLGLPAPGSAKP